MFVYLDKRFYLMRLIITLKLLFQIANESQISHEEEQFVKFMDWYENWS